MLRAGRPALDPSDPALRLTAEQQAAFVDDRELCLEAGAGAGKTHTLALRFVALLVREAWAGDDPGRVLVLTFTEKAAEEMADRCRARLEQAADAAHDAALDLLPADRERWVVNLRRMVASFDRARISTFHGFCAAVLREFPGPGRTPPGAAVLDPILAREAALAALAAELAATPDDDVLRLLDAFGSRRGVLAAAGSVLARRSALGDAVARAARGRPSLAERLAAAPLPPERVRAELARWSGLVDLLLRVVAPSGGGPGAEAFREAAAAVKAEGTGPLHDAARLRAALLPWLTDRGTLRSLEHPSVAGPRRAWPDEHRHAQARAALQALGARAADAPALARRVRTLPTPADEWLHAVLPAFAALVEGAAARLDDGLRQRGELTFDALQDRAVAAVTGDDEVRRLLRERHRWLMVDEFQDTDARQWALVQALGRADAAVPEDRVFVVGDAKQAIYSFRGGDVTVFHEAARAIGHTASLTANFRSRDALVTWFNAVFPAVFGQGDEPWEARFAPLVAGRGEPGGDVVWLEDEAPEERVADAVAGALGAGFGTVAVLLRARTRQDRYEQALRARGIPYTVPAGVGFWARPEVRDLVNVLVAAATGDLVATLAWLRSPLGGLTDAEVHALGGDGVRAVAAGEGPSAAATQLRALRATLSTSLPSRWLEERIRELAPAWVVEDDGGRALRNARRLVDRLRPLDGRGAAAVARFAGRAVADEEREGEAPPPGTSGVVLTTVHGAKGLEFDVVVVPELDARPAGDRAPVKVARLNGAWHLAFDVDDPTAAVQSLARPGLAEALRQQLRAEADAEDRRLLYVAATRARDALVLVTRPVGEGDPAAFPTWAQRLRAVLPPSTRRETGWSATGVAPAPSAPAGPPLPWSPVPPPARPRGVAVGLGRRVLGPRARARRRARGGPRRAAGPRAPRGPRGRRRPRAGPPVGRCRPRAAGHARRARRGPPPPGDGAPGLAGGAHGAARARGAGPPGAGVPREPRRRGAPGAHRPAVVGRRRRGLGGHRLEVGPTGRRRRSAAAPGVRLGGEPPVRGAGGPRRGGVGGHGRGGGRGPVGGGRLRAGGGVAGRPRLKHPPSSRPPREASPPEPTRSGQRRGNRGLGSRWNAVNGGRDRPSGRFGWGCLRDWSVQGGMPGVRSYPRALGGS